MREWVRMTPEERRQVRQNYARAQAEPDAEIDVVGILSAADGRTKERTGGQGGDQEAGRQPANANASQGAHGGADQACHAERFAGRGHAGGAARGAASGRKRSVAQRIECDTGADRPGASRPHAPTCPCSCPCRCQIIRPSNAV
jgi:hypothetical protein